MEAIKRDAKGSIQQFVKMIKDQEFRLKNGRVYGEFGVFEYPRGWNYTINSNKIDHSKQYIINKLPDPGSSLIGIYLTTQ